MYRSNWFLLLVVMLALSVSACQPVMPETAVVAQSVSDVSAEEAVRAVSTKVAEVYAQGDAAAFAALYSEEAMILPPNSEIVTGRSDIETLWQGAMDSGVIQLEIVLDELEVQGDTAIERGHAHLLLANGTSVDTIKYILIWKEQDGKWQIYREIWNSNLPVPTAE